MAVHSDPVDRVRGILLGLAAGDRNGGPIRLAVRLAESLVELESFNEEDIFRRYLEWWKHGAFDTGPTAGAILALVASGVGHDVAVRQVHKQSGERTAGCNPAHRSAPLAMAGFIQEDRLADCAITEARLTHWDSTAGDVAAASVTICRALVNGRSWQESLKIGEDGRVSETRDAFSPTDPDSLSVSGYAPEALRAALYFVGSESTFSEALGACIDFAGPANYSPVLVGALAGARWGSSQILSSHLSHCSILERVEHAADFLASSRK
ncbi:ADP-ribosylglycohydrolase family protein [Acidobacteria bacterium AH-259-O06]|nr:ADP-ribosylglycohydrolase family protein [Acidobacteria bacterium AH-259-O06]